jgi:hypothetical protein
MVGAATSSIDNSGYRSVRASGVGAVVSRMTVRLSDDSTAGATSMVGEQSRTRGGGMWPEGSRNW